MTDISTWSKTDDTNNDATKSGMPEGMARTDVNNRGREHMGAIRRWYEDAEWVDLLDEDENNFTVQRVTATEFRAIDVAGGGTNATSKFAVGSWCRVTGTGGTTVVVGRIASIAAYADPNTNVTLDTIKNASTWVDDVLPTSTVTQVEMYISKSAREATFHTVGVTLAQTPQQIPTIDQLSTVVTKTEGAGGGIDADLLDGLEASAFALAGGGGGGGGVGKNLLINGSFNIWQRGTPVDAASYGTNENGNYCADRWLLLSQDEDSGGTPTARFEVSRTGATPLSFGDPRHTSRYALNLLAINTDGASNSNKGGICQIIESANLDEVRESGNVSLSFDARTDVAFPSLTKIRCAVLRDTGEGTPDNITASAIIGRTFTGWGGGSETTDPTLVGWNYLQDASAATSKEFTLDGNWSPRRIFEGLLLDGTDDGNYTANLAVFIWIQDTGYTSGQSISISNVKLEAGSTASTYTNESVADEIDNCERYFSKTYDLDTEPGTITNNGTVVQPSSVTTTVDFAAGGALIPAPFRNRMRVVPTVTVIAPGTGTIGSVSGGSDGDLAASDHEPGESGTKVLVTANPLTNQTLKAHVVADAEIG
jgi:hypothetical protein